ncbi:Ion-trans-2 domain-containing protein [Aphelenchoides besseyi]|nr:Ion-trans-2 domain-containing protein [Aphelenchoides besseyi]KAI6201791.1 Ion-trans-2 domain-containing protein [Aphelenchoides besseyi]
MGYTMQPRFHLAFRRTLFYSIMLAVYLTVGSLIFFILWRKGSPVRVSDGSSEKLDFERAELLNVLYAESIGRSEHDWALLANSKLDSYERSLIERTENGIVQTFKQRRISLGYAFKHAFSLVTTIGPVDIDEMSIEIKLFSIIFSFIGIPLMLLYLGQCAKAISSVFPSFRTLIPLVIAILFGVAILYDVVEEGSDDTPFIDAVLSVFFTMTTIGLEDNKNELPPILLYATAIFALSAFTVTFVNIQHEIEKMISPYELTFAVNYAHLERAISGNRLEVLDEANEEEDEVSEWT